MKPRVRRLAAGLVAGCIGTAVAMALMAAGVLASWEAVTFDIRARLLARPGPRTDDIRIILLDQQSLDWAKTEFGLGWPWPRQAYVPVVDFCRRAGAASLVFDVVFTEPSVYGVSDDTSLGEAFARYGRVVLPADFAKLDGSDETWPGHAPPSDIPHTGSIRADGANVATFPIPELARHAAVIGNVNVSPDPDTVYRRVPLLTLFDDRLVPSLPLAALRLDRPDTRLAFTPDGVAIHGETIRTDRNGAALLNYRGPTDTYRTYSAASVMESGLRLAEGQPSQLDLAQFKGKHVLFGFSATGLYDLRPTPMGGVSPGVMINATVLDNLLSGDFMRRSSMTADGLAALCFALLAGAAIMGCRRVSMAALLTGAAVAAPVALSLTMYRAGVWFGLTPQLMACLVTIFLASGHKYATEGRQKRYIKNAFRQYLSPHVIEQLLAHPERLTLGGERRELSIFFSDLQGFTTISEGLDPESLTAVLNDYLTAMTDIIQDLGGTIDKYEGDAIIAFWNAPVDQPDHARRAVRAALECQRKLAAMRPDLLRRTGNEFHMRIGINTGHAVVGNLGSHSRFDYTMLGDAVNLAARLEGLNKQFGTYTMISQSTLDALGEGFYSRELSRVRVVGKNEAVTVYEPMDEQEHRARAEELARFDQGLRAFYAGEFSRAVSLFSAATDDPAAARYATKCRALVDDPPDLWDGVWTMSSK